MARVMEDTSLEAAISEAMVVIGELVERFRDGEDGRALF
jgi:hypothetical protein